MKLNSFLTIGEHARASYSVDQIIDGPTLTGNIEKKSF